jgi:hypothetical protein
MLTISIDVAFFALDICKYFVGVDSESAVVSDGMHVVSFDLVVDHHLNYLGWIVSDLLQWHVDFDCSEDLWLIVYFLDVLEICHYGLVMDRKWYVLDVDEDLLDWSITRTTYLDFDHDGFDQYLVEFLGCHVKLILLIIQFVENALQVSHGRLFNWEIIENALIERFIALLEYFAVERHDFSQNESILLYLFPLEIHLEELELFELEEGLERVLSVDTFKHFIENDIEFKLAFEVGRHEFVFGFDVDDEFPQALVVDA